VTACHTCVTPQPTLRRSSTAARTRAGRDLDRDHYQAFYAGLARERELEHDLQVYRAYEQAEARPLERGAHIERVVLDHELKSEYQRWLHERDKVVEALNTGAGRVESFVLPYTYRPLWLTAAFEDPGG